MDANLREYVVDRSQGFCEYCLISQRYFSERFQIEHVIAHQHRGETIASNLAIACSRCNRHKGPNLAGIDPESGALTRLFNPRSDTWIEHFVQRSSGIIEGLTAIGRTTTYVLDFNAERRVELRAAIEKLATKEL
ncbi:HNH endonuclease [Rosistilla carotiformis]|uniref:HNH endonuclease n=1 Tax=Rosistilla carotiformis TaxID=2528017 RepID=A0A518JSP1_9BACT|nr:HNH endonuclease signature motif containing protein [Rosistilla carotiformis]QDV68564.1 HNH endonuclease [Rosistilla carotiformis]